MTQALVTGGAGFIGSHVVRGLLDAGVPVRVLDNLSTGRESNIEEVRSRIDWIHGDICDAPTAQRAMQGVDWVFHIAARPSVPRSLQEPLLTNHVNITGTLTLLVAAREAGVKKFVYSASSSAYGDTVELPKRESMVPQPQSPYAVSKLAGEHYCRAFSHVWGLPTVSLRYFNVFGPRQDPTSAYAAVIPAFVSRILQGQPPIIFGDGEQSRDFCFVDNVVRANLLAARAEGLRGQVVNIACGESVTLNRVVERINRELGTSLKAEHQPPRAGDVRHSLADLRAASELIGYTPAVRFEEGLQHSITWYRENLAPGSAR